MIKKGRLWGMLCIGCFVFLFMSVSTGSEMGTIKGGRYKYCR